MQACTATHTHSASFSPEGKERPALDWGPICCRREMQEVVRRAILRSDGKVVFCAVWECLNCGRMLL